MPTPYHTLSDDTLNLLAERGNAQALMELGYRAERLGILAEAQELAKRLREPRKDARLMCNRCQRAVNYDDARRDPRNDEPWCGCLDNRLGD